MANATTTKRTTRSKNTQPVEVQAENEATIEAVEAKPVKAAKKIVAKDIDPNQYVVVRNGYQGTLIYKSTRTGEMFTWDGFGAEQEMELRELRAAKNSSKGFFINNWFMFEEDWILDYLGVRQFYKNAISIDDFDDIFSMKANELKATVSKLSNGQKRSVAYRAKELIDAQEIDSLSVISALEDALGIGLIEK